METNVDYLQYLKALNWVNTLKPRVGGAAPLYTFTEGNLKYIKQALLATLACMEDSPEGAQLSMDGVLFELDNTKLKQRITSLEGFVNLVATQLSAEDYKACGINAEVVLNNLVDRAKKLLETED